jgi:transglutaminase-like putative cysteine protease
MAPDSLAVCLAKAAIAAAAGVLFFLPLSTTPGLFAVVAGVFAGYLAARATGPYLRLGTGVVVGALIVGLGHVVSQFILSRTASSTTTLIVAGDVALLGLACAGVAFAIRILAQRVRALTVLEFLVVVLAVSHTFADHRSHRIHQPRWLTDWAWSNGIDPQIILTAAGVAVVGVAVFMLLRRQSLAKLLLSLLLLFVVGFAGYWLARDWRITPPPAPEDLITQDDKRSGGGGRKPDPIAVVLLHQELAEDADILYFRQTVRSRLAGDRLVEDTSGAFDRDIITQFPAGAPVIAEATTQAPELHETFRTSMFLLVGHPEPFGLGHPTAYGPLDNPDPRRFVAAYDVESQVSTSDLSRLVGRTALPEPWTDEEKQHYLAIPDDPRYAALAQLLVREIDPKFVGDPVMTAYVIKRFLEVEGFYSLQQKEMVGNEPTATFLFGALRGYCVHFAHAAVFLFRSQGIPARVALGYAITARRRGAGSSLLVMGNEAHAWPEIYLDGVGWVTIDIYPERSDEPPPVVVDEDLESLFGELARKDKTGGMSADPNAIGFSIPWSAIGIGILLNLAGLLVVAFGIKIVRRATGSTQRQIYRGTLDRLSDLGLGRRVGESRERHAARLAAIAPSFAALTRAHLRWALGPTSGGATVPDLRTLARTTQRELRANLPFGRRVVGALNPIGWWFTR